MNLVERSVNRLCKWRAIFARWQLGTRVKGDPESDAVRDHREITILLRAEVNAITAMLLKKGIFTQEEFSSQVMVECEFLNKAYEKRFPGMTAELDGMHLQMPEAANTMRGWRP